MNLVQNITTIIFGMHEQLSCQCINIHLGMRDGKMATDEELLTMQRTLNVIKSLRKELEMVTAGMVVVEQPMQESHHFCTCYCTTAAQSYYSTTAQNGYIKQGY
jgi:hypothetical protein